MKGWLILAGAALAAVGATWAYLAFAPGAAVRTAVVTRGTIRAHVDERAKTRLSNEYLVTMPFAGRVEEIMLEEGARVSAGQQVARLSPPDLAHEVAEARAAVERLEASLVENADVSVEHSLQEQARLFVESMVSTVAAAEARTTSSRSRLDFAERFLGRTRQTAERGAETQTELERAEVSFVESQIGYRQDVLTAAALKAVQAATNLMPRMVQEYIARKSLAGDVLDRQREEARVRLDQALLRQQRGTLVSPVDGVVLARLVRDEQYLAGGTPLLRIGDLRQLEVEAEILSEDVGRLALGDPVEVYGPAVGADVGGGAQGTLARVFPAGFTKISSLGVEQQRVKVVVHFAAGELARLSKERELGVDYRVRVRIFTDQRANVLLLPRSAIFRGEHGSWEVFAVVDGRAQRLPIDVGLMNDEAVEVRSGLDEGATVILAPESTLTVGARVSPASA